MQITNNQWNQLVDDYWCYIGSLPKKQLSTTNACARMLDLTIVDDTVNVISTSGKRILPVDSYNEYEGYNNEH